MPLTSGQSLAFYEILDVLGAGGMGEVYRARDTRLEREVAIKVLPDELAGDEERLRRFEREAKTLASLNHPNVAGIHGIDQVADTCFLAMELVRGEDLEERLRRGALPLDEALDVCRQIAEGLEAAHEAGVVHRDLKPANVCVTPDGIVKLLDFGIAKPIRPDTAKGRKGASESDSFLVTSEGMILGTPTYMSPEQARGKPVDRRTDVWAYGCVLYECLTGQRAFEGDAFGDLIAAILQDEVDLDLLPAATPRRVRELIVRCLVKDPRRRLRDVGEARLVLERPTDDEPASERVVAAEAGGRRGARFRGLLGVGIGGTALALAGWWIGSQRPSVERWSRLTQLTDAAGAETAPALSPDGGSFAYAARGDTSWDVFVQRVGGRNRIAVAAKPDVDEAWPAFSPDGRLIAYHESDRDGGIWTVGATGESNRRLTEFGFNPAWSPDGEHIAFVTAETQQPHARLGVSTLWRIPASGGEPEQLCEFDSMQPAWSPSGERIAVWIVEDGQRDLATVSARGGDRVVLLDDAPLDWSPTWSPEGNALYFSSDRGGSLGLWRLAIDEATGRAEGEPEPVLSGLEASLALPGFSADGRHLIFRSETISMNPAVLPFDPDTERAGTPRELLHRTGILRPVSVSPSGEWLTVYNRGERQEDLFVMRTDGSELRRLTDDPARDRRPYFSPDGESIVFYSNRGEGGAYGSYSIRPDGSALVPLSAPSIGTTNSPTLEPGGERLLCSIGRDDARTVLASPPWPFTLDRTVELTGLELPAGTLRPITWSPDGKRIAGAVVPSTVGASVAVGVYDVATGRCTQLSSDGGLWMVPWLPDGERVIYFTADGELVVIDVESGERRVIDVDLPFPPAEDAFAVSPDGTSLYYAAERIESNIWMVEREP